MALTKSAQAVWQGSPVSASYQPVASEATTLITDLYDGHLDKFRVGSLNDPTGLGAPSISVQGTSTGTSRIAAMRASADTSEPSLTFAKSRGAAIDTYTIVQTGDVLGSVSFYGADGSSTVRGAQIRAYVIGTPAAGDVRGALQFLTGSGVGTIATRLEITATVATFNLPPVLPSYTVGSLPSAATVGAGAMAYVTDSSVTTFNSTVAAGGANKIKVTSDGTNWKVG